MFITKTKLLMLFRRNYRCLLEKSHEKYSVWKKKAEILSVTASGT